MADIDTVKICVIKAGSAVVTRKDGRFDFNIIDDLCRQIAELSEEGWRPVLVTSGAVASGRGIMSAHVSSDLDPHVGKKLFAAVGQSRLLGFYKEMLESTHATLHAAQVLVTRDAFSNRHQYDELKEALLKMLENQILPIVNNNDVLYAAACDFSDNDQLAAYLAGMLGAEILVLLTDVDGVFSKNPKTYPNDAVLIERLVAGEAWPSFCLDNQSVSNGGMRSKINAFDVAASLGIRAAILPGKKENILTQALLKDDRSIGTFLDIPEERRRSNDFDTWLVTGAAPMGTLIVSNLGAEAMRNTKHRSSVLASGMEACFGNFRKGDVVAVRAESFELLGLGHCEYSAEDLQQIGRRSDTVVVHANRLAPFRKGTALPTEQSVVTTAATRLRSKGYVCTRDRKTFEVRKRGNGFRVNVVGESEIAWAFAAEKQLGIPATDWILFTRLCELESESTTP
jgi:glutamate 5-kinase